MSERCIEPMMGATYGPSFEGEVAVYEYGEYERGSVLYGRRKRIFLDSGTLEEMTAKFPEATVVQGSGYIDDPMLDLSDSEEPDDWPEDFDEDY